MASDKKCATHPHDWWRYILHFMSTNWPAPQRNPSSNNYTFEWPAHRAQRQPATRHPPPPLHNYNWNLCTDQETSSQVDKWVDGCWLVDNLTKVRRSNRGEGEKFEIWIIIRSRDKIGNYYCRCGASCSSSTSPRSLTINSKCGKIWSNNRRQQLERVLRISWP